MDNYVRSPSIKKLWELCFNHTVNSLIIERYTLMLSNSLLRWTRCHYVRLLIHINLNMSKAYIFLGSHPSYNIRFFMKIPM